MKWKDAAKVAGKVEIPPTWIHLHYYDAVNVLFRVENALRLFVYIILKAYHAEHWRSLNIASDEGKEVTIAAATSQRRNQDEEYGYLGFPATCPLLYLTSGELSRLIMDETNWKYFRPYFTAKKDIVKTKLAEIGNVRNALAHFRPLAPGDVSVLKQNAMHVFPKVEACLGEVLGCHDVVPTNLDEPWYRLLSVVGSDFCRLTFSQSHDATWVKIHISYLCQVVREDRNPKTRWYRLTTVKTPAILELWPTILNSVIFLNETVPHAWFDGQQDPTFSKTITLTFAGRTLIEKHAVIAEAIGSLLKNLTEETELVKTDHLARGRVVYGASTSANLMAGTGNIPPWWQLDKSRLREPEDSTDAPEYLGSWDSMSLPDFITDSPRFAWMSVDVSELDVPF